MSKILKLLLGLAVTLVVLFVSVFVATSGHYPVPKTLSDDASIPRVTINGVTFHAQTFGDPANPVVVVVHGGPGWDYKSLLPLQGLADEFYVVFYDQRGAGLSPRVGQESLTLASYLQDLDAIVGHYAGDQKVSLIGHSWGAMLVSAYLGKHPNGVSHAVLAEPGFLTTEMAQAAGIRFGPTMDLHFLLFASTAWFQSLHVDGPDEQASSDYFLGEVAPRANPEYYCDEIVPQAGVEHWRAGSISMKNVMRLITDSEGNVDVDLIEGVDKFRDPVLFLASECNIKIGEAHQRRQMKYFPNARLAVIQQSGHMMFGERPVQSLEVVRAYLKR